MSLRLIRNPHIVQRLTKEPEPLPSPMMPFKKWGSLAAPVHASDNDALARAKSILRCFEMRDREPHCDLTIEQARDIHAWAKGK